MEYLILSFVLRDPESDSAEPVEGVMSNDETLSDDRYRRSRERSLEATTGRHGCQYGTNYHQRISDYLKSVEETCISRQFRRPRGLFGTLDPLRLLDTE